MEARAVSFKMIRKRLLVVDDEFKIIASKKIYWPRMIFLFEEATTSRRLRVIFNEPAPQWKQAYAEKCFVFDGARDYFCIECIYFHAKKL